MATDAQMLTHTFLANADLSASQFCAVKLVNASGTAQAAVATQNDRTIGVLQNDPDAQGRAATVAVNGVTKAKAGAAITAGAALTVDNTGRVITVASSTEFEIGIALKSAGAANEIIPILLTQFGIQ